MLIGSLSRATTVAAAALCCTLGRASYEFDEPLARPDHFMTHRRDKGPMRRALHWDLDEALQRTGYRFPIEIEREHAHSPLNPDTYTEYDHGLMGEHYTMGEGHKPFWKKEIPDLDYEFYMANSMFRHAECFADADCPSGNTCEVVDSLHHISRCIYIGSTAYH